ncbi:ATPase family AAA domain-containing protein At1g05910 [Quercus robur]|uniref:ATPase family AAA domain-containing protein At1g05910 n=1 Tax=Quercus robur TaxID=38942 RepID=UPI002162E72D|nr:ATPase family AAA domain-containing protein At1g05910 [Quercus robur]XP_050256683.1 ATPase family AAA domain-containing protein At1g05910 [Quercus robur]XP_050256684.1 ATPase family AAA domain-containing protein At1g05910 [Quercus robur]
MHSKKSGGGGRDGEGGGAAGEGMAMPVRTSDRLRRRPKMYGRAYLYYTGNIRKQKTKSKTRTAASQIAKMLCVRTPSKDSVATNLRRSTRKRRVSVNLEDYTDSSGTEDEDLMRPTFRRLRNRVDNSMSHDDLSSPKRRKIVDTKPAPRREGLRPRRSKSMARERLELESDDEQGTSLEKAGQDDMENGNDVDDNDADDGQNEGEGEDEDDGEDEGDDDGDGDDEEGEEEQEGRRRYDLRNRAEVRRLSMEEGKPRPRSPRRVLHQGMGTKVGRDVRKGGSRVHKRHRMTRAEDSDDSLLVDELDQGPAIPWGRGGSRSGPPWLLGGLEMHGTTAWGLNIAASGWGHQGDAFTTLTSGIQTAGPSSKGGADIQPLQVDESVSFNDIGGLSEYIDALKEMVFFPLLYPDFFDSYHITPPRGVLLCGPPGTGKTLIARALACAASKAGQKVSFYMRKGADVLSKWVGEAERQLKLLFEEAQRNQPSIIFFDEIDGLAPVRSSKQEQIHNSIVSTLLALMDGLDSRGQVVLIGATNRIDAIDGALRRPGRFDREFNFPLPGCEARAEILDIHTRKWKHPPSKELKLELAASCVGYCGADLKALCTEAAIRAFREKYPQVYTSDDKFVIDVDSVKVEKYHFVEAMSTITPAAHRGAVVHSRPLSSVVAPCLQRHLQKAMNTISDIFPPIAVSSELTKLSMLSYGSAIPLVYRPRLLLYGGEGTGLDHIGPAILHEMEKFPVHSLGLPALLSDPSAKTPEEALVHIFGEARRTTPSILYLPQFNLWWENAHEQLRAVLQTLLEELPSDLPILFLGTSSVPLAEIEDVPSSIFSLRYVYQVSEPSAEDRSLFFDRLIEAALSVLSEGTAKKSPKSASLTELPKAPKVASGPKVSELKAKVEAEQHALRRLRMCLRDVCNRVLYDKRFSAFHFPVLDEDAPNYRSIIQNPLDVSTLLQRVDSGQYITCSTFAQEVDLIVSNAKAYNGDDYNGARIVSRAYELRDAVHGMLSQMDPALVAYCDKIAAQGGPMHLPDDLAGSTFPSNPVVQLGTVTRVSARLRNVQPEVNLDQSYEALKRQKKNADAAHAASTVEDKSRQQDSQLPKSSQEPETNDENPERPETSSADGNQHETSGEASGHADGSGSEDVVMSDGDISNQVESVKLLLVKHTASYSIPQLERLYTRIMKGIFETKAEVKDDLKPSILRYLLKFAEDEANF